MTMAAFAYTPNNLTSNQTIQVSRTPSTLAWIANGSSYATYNGHIQQEHDNSFPYYPYFTSSNNQSLATANMTVTSLSSTSSNLSVSLRDIFTNAPIPGMNSIWFAINTTSGNVLSSNEPHITGYPCFFYLPNANTLKIGDKVLMSTPANSSIVSYKVNRSEMVLGVPTIQLVNTTSITSPPYGMAKSNTTLWFSNTTNANTNGLLMRIKGIAEFLVGKVGYRLLIVPTAERSSAWRSELRTY